MSSSYPSPWRVTDKDRLYLLAAAVYFVILILVLVVRPFLATLLYEPAESGGLPLFPDAQVKKKAAPVPLDRAFTWSLPKTAPAGLPELERLIFERVNKARKQHGLPPLKPLPDLTAIARAHSQDMLLKGFFSHVDPNGVDPGMRVARAGRRLIGLAGENLSMAGNLDPAKDLQQLAKEIMTGLMNSPGHRANILKPDFNRLGVGCAARGDEVLTTQMFYDLHALLKNPLPDELKGGPGKRISASLVRSSKGVKTRFVWASQKDPASPQFFDLKSTRKNVSLEADLSSQGLIPGIYRLSLAEGGSVYPGPVVRLKQ